MNSWQATKQLVFKLETAAWPDSPGGPVFATVHGTQGVAEEIANDYRTPFAVVRVLDAQSDAQSPGLKEQSWEIVICTAHAGDQVGEFALLGGQRASQGKSQGRGLLEVEEQLLNVVNFLDQTQQVNIVAASAGAAQAALVTDRGYVLTRAYTIRGRLTTARTYPAPNGTNVLTAALGTPSGGLTPVTVSWASVEQRFDLHPAYATPVLPARGSLALVRKGGSAAPLSPTDGTVVTIGAFATSVVDSITSGSGAWTYGLFAKYDEFGDGTTSIRTSAPATKTVTV